jgi:hypothetical protein
LFPVARVFRVSGNAGLWLARNWENSEVVFLILSSPIM